MIIRKMAHTSSLSAPKTDAVFYRKSVGAEQSPAPTLQTIVCALKSLTTKAVNRQNNTPGEQLWQRSYYEHVIRNNEDYLEIWKYIDGNPSNWLEDQDYRKT